MLTVGSSRLLSKNSDAGSDFFDMVWIFQFESRITFSTLLAAAKWPCKCSPRQRVAQFKRTEEER
jgi:hypothetical protein